MFCYRPIGGESSTGTAASGFACVGVVLVAIGAFSVIAQPHHATSPHDGQLMLQHQDLEHLSFR